MEIAKLTYKTHTGKDPMNLTRMGECTAKTMAGVLSPLYHGNFTTDPTLHALRFYTAKKISESEGDFEFTIMDITKDGKKSDEPVEYAGVRLTTKQIPTEMLPYIHGLKSGQSVTFYHEGHNANEIANMTRADLSVKTNSEATSQIERIMAKENITNEMLFNDPFQVYGNESTGYLVGLPIVNERGIHMRPAGLIVQIKAKPEYQNCDVYLKKIYESPANAASIISVLMLEAAKNAKIIGEASGPHAKPCLEEIAKLIQSGFGDMNS